MLLLMGVEAAAVGALVHDMVVMAAVLLGCNAILVHMVGCWVEAGTTGKCCGGGW